jgi:hypothetical protein
MFFWSPRCEKFAPPPTKKKKEEKKEKTLGKKYKSLRSKNKLTYKQIPSIPK